MSERGVDPESNVDVILCELNATPAEHKWAQEEEWLMVCGYPDRVAWRWAELAAHRDPEFSRVLDELGFDARVMESLGVEWP